jgi:drug/metabolite transporter (DMT)-like permease
MASVYALISSLIWGTADYLGGRLTRTRSSFAVTGGSQPFGLLATLISVAIFGSWELSPQIAINGALSGALGLTGLLAFYTALATGRMGIVSPISSMGVIIPFAIGIISGDQPSPIQLVGVVIAIAGIVLASGPELSGGAPVRPAYAAFAFGLCVYFMSKGGQINPGMTVVAMRFTQVAIMASIALIMRSNGGLKRSDIKLLAVLGATDAIANVFYTTAAGMGMLSIVAVLGSLFPVVTVVLAWALDKERLMVVQYFGIAIAIGGVAAITAG